MSLGRYLLRRAVVRAAARLRRLVGGAAADAARRPATSWRRRPRTIPRSSPRRRAELGLDRPVLVAVRRLDARAVAPRLRPVAALHAAGQRPARRTRAATPRCSPPSALAPRRSSASRWASTPAFGSAGSGVAARARASRCCCCRRRRSSPRSRWCWSPRAPDGFRSAAWRRPARRTLSWARWLADVARHVPLPALALALPLAATLERLQSQAMRDAIGEPFVARRAGARAVDRSGHAAGTAGRCRSAPCSASTA